MSNTKQRELGGKPHRKIPPKEYVVEPAPSHDSAPCFAAYTIDIDDTSRPQFAICVYDTTPAAGNPDRTRDLALKIHRGTEEERLDRSSNGRDRIEVFGMPMPQDASEEQRIEACMAHHTAELAARRHHRGFYLPWTFDNLGWRHEIVILVRLGEGWEGVALYRPRPKTSWEGGCFIPPENHMSSSEDVRADPYGQLISVRWDLTELARKQMEELDDPLPEVAVTLRMMWELAYTLEGCRDHISTFQCFVHDGGLEKGLQGEAYDGRSARPGPPTQEGAQEAIGGEQTR